jgi:cytochrome c oxidase subunit II
MAIAIAVVLLMIGTILFHFLSPWWFTPIASNWTTMDDTVNLTFWVTGIVFAAVNLFLAYAVIRYRHRKGQRAFYEPENKKLEWWLTGITTVGIAALLAPGLTVWARFVTVPEGTSVVEVLGQQWYWSYRFPGSDGALGQTDAHLITLDNPFGMDPDDAQGADDVLVASPELHLPVDVPVKLVLRSRDVLHQFAVPQFRVKMDMVPGMVTSVWLTPTRTGAFDALCEQLCGLAHFVMRGRVVVDEPDDFRKWLDTQPTFAATQSLTAGDPERGRPLFGTCAACHGAAGEGNQTLNSPRLSGQSAWYLVRQLGDFRSGVRGAHEGDIYGKQMVPFAASLADEAAIRDVVAYIGTLPETSAPPTVRGDPNRGRALYTTCAACHGSAAEGIWATNAPRLAGMSDWYLARQLGSFKQAIRGSHPQDFSGAQMIPMARILSDERDVGDLLAYVQSLQARQDRNGRVQ